MKHAVSNQAYPITLPFNHHTNTPLGRTRIESGLSKGSRTILGVVLLAIRLTGTLAGPKAFETTTNSIKQNNTLILFMVYNFYHFFVSSSIYCTSNPVRFLIFFFVLPFTELFIYCARCTLYCTAAHLLTSRSIS